MPKFPLDLSKFEKISATDKKTTLKHKDGHFIVIAHAKLKPDMQKALSGLAFAKGGKVKEPRESKEDRTFRKFSDKLITDKSNGHQRPEGMANEVVGYVDAEGNIQRGQPPKKMADGGEVAEPDPQKAKEMQAGATQSGWQPEKWAKNVKEGLGFDVGGKVPSNVPNENPITQREEDVAPEVTTKEEDAVPSGEDRLNYMNRVHEGFTQKLAKGGKIERAQHMGIQKGKKPSRLYAEGGEIDDTLPPLQAEPVQPEAPMQSSAPESQPQVEAVSPDQAAPTPKAAAPEAQPEAAPTSPQQMTFSKGETDAAYDPTQQLAPRSISQQMHAEDDAMAQDMATGHITPKTYGDLFAEKSTLGKVSTIFGLLASGLGSGLSHQPNALLKMMDKTIERDLDSQKQSASNRQNFYKIRQQQILNDAAVRLTKAQAQEKELGNKATRYGLNQAGILGTGVTQDKNGKVALTPAGELQARTQAKMDTYNAAAHDLEQRVAKMPPNHPMYAATVGALNDLRGMMAQEKQQMTQQVDKAHQAEEDANDPISKITGVSRSKLPPMPEVATMLHPDADKKIMGLSAAAAGSPMFAKTFEPVLQQYNAAKQIDEVLKDLPKTFQDLTRLRHWSQRVAGPLASLAPAIGGATGAGLGARSGNPMGGAYVGEGVGEGLKQGLKAISGTERNRLYDASVAKLGGVIMNARIPNLGHEEAMRWAQLYAPVAGDSDAAVNWKLTQLGDKIKMSVPHGLLDAQGLSR